MGGLCMPMTATFGVVIRQVQARSVENSADQASDVWSDERLVASFLAHGHPQHFRALLARHKQRVHQVALSVLGPAMSAHAEDVAQEVFIRIYERLDQFRGDSAFSTWLYRLTFNLAMDYRRTAQRHQATPLDEANYADTRPVTDPQNGRLRPRVQAALWQLPESQRMIVHLHYWLDLKIREIAAVLDCPEGTIKVYLRRARKALAEHLEHSADE